MTSTKINAVILCGGSGTRLWPLSREKLPKQLLPLVNSKSMLQNTILRLHSISKIPHASNLCINQFVFICNQDHSFIIKQQIDELDQELGLKSDKSIQKRSVIITEPEGRNTAPAIAISSLYFPEDDLSLVIPSDHVFDDEDFMSLVSKKIIDYNESISLFGILPKYPATGYGYIESAGIMENYKAISFVEKPDIHTATHYLSTGKYFWNAGVFLFRNKVIISCFEKYSPEILQCCKDTILFTKGQENIINLPKEQFSKCENISIDYAIMEKVTKDKNAEVPMFAFPYGGTWCDVGSFESLHEHLLNEMNNKKKDNDNLENVVKGDNLLHDTRDCIIYSEKGLVSTIGVSNLVIVSTPDVVLVCDKNKTQEIKKVVQHLKQEKRPEAALHQKVYRPWGWYINIDGNDHSGSKIKRLVVLPGKRLSLQTHKKREEHWVVVKGKASVQLDQLWHELEVNDYIHIPIGAMHRVENTGTDLLEIVETQIGEYLGEDDIVRYQDDFGRV
jgi:mannose-1-phosphate guanylyltransferase/mannose-6-phosphate isomerase